MLDCELEHRCALHRTRYSNGGWASNLTRATVRQQAGEYEDHIPQEHTQQVCTRMYLIDARGTIDQESR